MVVPILATKLYIPPPPPHVVLRSHLLARLNAGLHRKLTLISAPAGFGKSTLLSAWVAGCHWPVGWLSLDVRDSDPARFLTYLVAALQTVAPQSGAGALGALQRLADIWLAQGWLHAAMSTCERGLRLATAQHPEGTRSVLRGAADVHVGLNASRYEQNDLPAATQHLRRSQELGEHLGLPQNPYRWCVAMARLR